MGLPIWIRATDAGTGFDLAINVTEVSRMKSLVGPNRHTVTEVLYHCGSADRVRESVRELLTRSAEATLEFCEGLSGALP